MAFFRRSKDRFVPRGCTYCWVVLLFCKLQNAINTKIWFQLLTRKTQKAIIAEIWHKKPIFCGQKHDWKNGFFGKFNTTASTYFLWSLCWAHDTNGGKTLILGLHFSKRAAVLYEPKRHTPLVKNHNFPFLFFFFRPSVVFSRSANGSSFFETDSNFSEPHSSFS